MKSEGRGGRGGARGGVEVVREVVGGRVEGGEGVLGLGRVGGLVRRDGGESVELS